jgi:two-component system invasion response regulator UvrY
MLDAVRQVASGKVYVGQELMPFLLQRASHTIKQPVAELSPREFEVFRLLADSKSVNEIAELLNLSPKTVGHHVTSVKSKLGTSSVAGLTRLAIRLGVINP